MPEAALNFSQQFEKALRPLYWALSIVTLSVVFSLINFASYQYAIQSTKQSVARAARSIRTDAADQPSTTDADDQTGTAGSTAEFDRSIAAMTAALDAHNRGRELSEILTLIAILYLIYCMIRLRSTRAGLEQSYDEAIRGRDGKLEFLIG